MSSESDKFAFFDHTQQTGLRPEDYPHLAFGTAPRKMIRCFPDKLPIGIERNDTSRFVFLYLVNRRVPVDFRQFLEGAFADELALLQPTPGYMRLVKDRILHVWEQRRAEGNDRTVAQQRRVSAIQQKMDKLDEAFLYSEAIDVTT